MKKLLYLFILLAITACNRPFTQQPVKFQGLAQGTYYAVTYYDKQERNFQQEIDSLLSQFNQSASVYEPSSVISKINRNESFRTDSVFREVFRQGMEISENTHGAFDMTVMPLVNAWGFGFTNRDKLAAEKVDSIMQYVGFQKVSLADDTIRKTNPNVMIDFNAIAQGYSVDLVGEFLAAKDIENFLVDIGGEVLARGNKPGIGLWKVGIEKPTDNSTEPRTIKAVVSLKNRGLATSGNYRKYYEKDGVRYSHTINPETGYPVTHSLLSASVMAPDALTADAYATAFMVMGLDRAKSFVKESEKLEAYFIYSDNKGKMRTFSTSGMRRFMDVED